MPKNLNKNFGVSALKMGVAEEALSQSVGAKALLARKRGSGERQSLTPRPAAPSTQERERDPVGSNRRSEGSHAIGKALPLGRGSQSSLPPFFCNDGMGGWHPFSRVSGRDPQRDAPWVGAARTLERALCPLT